jgi:hypothetical protein
MAILIKEIQVKTTIEKTIQVTESIDRQKVRQIISEEIRNKQLRESTNKKER